MMYYTTIKSIDLSALLTASTISSPSEEKYSNSFISFLPEEIILENRNK